MQGQGRLQGQRQRLQRQELLQGQGWRRNRRLQDARRKEASLTTTFHWRVCPDRGLVKIAGPPSSLRPQDRKISCHRFAFSALHVLRWTCDSPKDRFVNGLTFERLSFSPIFGGSCGLPTSLSGVSKLNSGRKSRKPFDTA